VGGWSSSGPELLSELSSLVGSTVVAAPMGPEVAVSKPPDPPPDPLSQHSGVTSSTHGGHAGR
jgi:hypothetical protein